MSAEPRRRFGWGDAGIGTAAIALLLWLQPVEDGRWQRIGFIWNNQQGWNSRTHFGQVILLAGHCGMMPWFCFTLACIGWRVRSPRPPWDRMRCQPGTVAPLLAALLGGLHLGLLAMDSQQDFNLPVFRANFYRIIYSAGPGVIGGWIGLWLAGRWVGEPSWVDRLGRIVGLGWVGLYWFSAQ